MDNTYPMIIKMEGVREQSQLCGEFLEWLQSKYFMVDKKEPQEDGFIPLGYSSYINIEKLLAEYFNIDLGEVEKEKSELLDQFNRSKIV